MEITKVFYRHYRIPLGAENNNRFAKRYYRSGELKSSWEPATFGGKTECIVVVTYGRFTYEVMATAMCNPEDRFCYKDSRDTAQYKLKLLTGHIQALESLLYEGV